MVFRVIFLIKVRGEFINENNFECDESINKNNCKINPIIGEHFRFCKIFQLRGK